MLIPWKFQTIGPLYLEEVKIYNQTYNSGLIKPIELNSIVNLTANAWVLNKITGVSSFHACTLEVPDLPGLHFLTRDLIQSSPPLISVLDLPPAVPFYFPTLPSYLRSS